jgi:hypothetical protein
MKGQFVSQVLSGFAVGVALFAAPPLALAQREGAPAPPAAPQKSPASTPRAADGHPDLTGIWGGVPTPPPAKEGNVQVLLAVRGVNPDSKDVFKGLDRQAVEGRAAVPNKPVYKPELLAKVQDFSDKQDVLDPAFYCKPQGVPRMGPPSQIIQLPGQVVFLYTNSNWFRVIPTDGRPHRTDVDSAYLGDPVGHWEGDTLVVDVTGFNDDTWLTSDGYFHSEALHVVETFQRDKDSLTYSVTVEDPQVLAKPWVLNPRTMKLSTNPADVLVESPPCVERDAPHIVTFDHH